MMYSFRGTPKSSTSRWDVPLTIHLGVPVFMETPILPEESTIFSQALSQHCPQLRIDLLRRRCPCCCRCCCRRSRRGCRGGCRGRGRGLLGNGGANGFVELLDVLVILSG